MIVTCFYPVVDERRRFGVLEVHGSWQGHGSTRAFHVSSYGVVAGNTNYIPAELLPPERYFAGKRTAIAEAIHMARREEAKLRSLIRQVQEDVVMLLRAAR